MSEAPKREPAILVFTRKYGWIVAQPLGEDRRGIAPGRTEFAWSRPRGVAIERHHVLATHPLPPVPEEAA
jgi:hypothetical protein